VVLKVKVDDRQAPEVPSVTPIWATADWQEREVFDLMGIRFSDTTTCAASCFRGLEGYPLRKDYTPKPDRYD